MRTILTAAATLLFAHAAGSAAGAPTPMDQSSQELIREIEAAIAAPGWDPGSWTVMVVSLDAGETLFAHRAEVPAIPASNLKLFTTAAALRYLGPEYRYSTYLAGTGPIRNGTLDGDLYLYGTGDPTISDRFFDSKIQVWEQLADSLAALGISRVTGDLVGDASYFEGPGVGEGWQAAYVTHTYAATASALSFNDNIVTMRVTGAEETGAAPNIQFIPGGSIPIRNEATTTTSGRSHVEVEREGYGAPTVLAGTIRKGSSALWRAVPVSDPAAYAVAVLAEVLRDRGIQLDGDVRSVDTKDGSPITGRTVFAPTLDDAPTVQVLAVHRSPPLQEIVDIINQRSHNLYADVVLRTVGRVVTGRGSAQGGEAAVLALLEEAGLTGAELRMDDGSGLSLLDRASARSIVELLAYMADSPYGDAFMASLPEAATSRGLRRMQTTDAAGNLRAKTGTINRVSALSGYVSSSSGERLAFSIMANDVPSTWTAKRVEDRIGARLASFDRPIPQQLAAGQTRPDPASERPVSVGRSGEATVASERGESDGESAAEPQTSADPDPPASAEYVIQSGDTLEGIARRHDTTVEALRAANPNVNERRLIPGRSLSVPGS